MALTTAEAAVASGRADFKPFFFIWLGQVVSLIGSGLTSFAIGVWVYQETGNVTLFTLIATSAALPAIVLSPIAGVLVDRFDRKWMLIASDTGAALSSLALLLLFRAGGLEMWHIYLLVGINAAFNTIQFPAFGAAITLLIPKRHFGRASGMMQFGQSGARVISPLLAGWLISWLDVPAIIAIDLATFGFAVLLLLFFVTVPNPPPVAVRPVFWRQVAFGWQYIRARPGLVALLCYFAAINFLLPVSMVLVTPLVLSFAGADDLGLVLSISAAGMVIGSLVMTAWGGPANRVAGILGGAPFVVLGLFIAGARPSVPLIAAGMFLHFFVVPLINGSSQAIWQAKVEPAVQGRVFAMRRMVAQVTAPLAFFLAGPLAERVFVPLLLPGGALAGSVGGWLGTGEGRGIGLLFITLGTVFLLLTAFAAAYPRLRQLETTVPDAVPDEPPVAAP